MHACEAGWTIHHYTAVEDRYLVRFEVAVFNRDFITLSTPTGSPQVCDQRLTKVATSLRSIKTQNMIYYIFSI